MAVLLDPPMWPAHGTLWSHLVSDTSLAELHAFAVRAAIPARAFDLDHYDVPAERHAELCELGALDVPAHDLVRRLRAAGLRRTRAERVAERLELERRWSELTPSGGDAATWAATGIQVTARWRERGRLHHAVGHLLEVLDGVARLAAPEGLVGADRRAALLGAWFHDAVHSSGEPRGARSPSTQPSEPVASDEERSAILAGELLRGDAERDRVIELVRMTAQHRPSPDDLAARVLSDADLAVLGSSPARYAVYAAAIRAEYADVPETAFRAGRAQILENLLDGDLFATATGRTLWERTARANLEAEVRELRTAP